MHEVLIKAERDLTLSMPSCWEELRVEHVPAVIVARTVAWQAEHKAWTQAPAPKGQQKPPFVLRGTDAGLRLALFRELSGLPKGMAHRLPPAGDLTFARYEYGETVWTCIPQLDWVFTEPLRTASLLPTITIGGNVWNGPGDKLNNFSSERWMYADTLMANYQATEEPTARAACLLNLLAVLYQPAAQVRTTPEGTEEWYFSARRIEEHAAALAAMPMDQRYTALFNYSALRNGIPGRYRRVFAGGDGAPPPSGLFSIGHQAAKTGVFGNLDGVFARRMHDLLLFMEDELFEQEREEQRAKAAASRNA